SQWCGKEVEWFSADKRGRRDRRRIFVVRAWWTDETTWPAVLREWDGLGYSFLPRDAEEADPFGYPCSSESDPAYWTAVMKLAGDIAREIKVIARGDVDVAEVEGRVTPPDSSARPSSSPTANQVFLGFMSETLEEDRSELRARLS